MANERDALISALASGAPIDWGRLEHPAWGRALGPAADAEATPGARLRRLGTKVFESAWLAVAVLAALQAAVAFTGTRLYPAQPGTSSPTWLLAANALLFGAAGLLLVVGGAGDRRVRALGALFTAIGASCAHPLLGRLEGASPDLVLRVLHAAPADAFVSGALWWFVWAFPAAPRSSVARWVGYIGVAVTTTLGVALFVANLPEIWNVSMRGPSEFVPAALDRDGFRSLYWPLLFVTALSAFPYLIWKSRSETVQGRHRTVFFVTALVVGLSPVAIAVLAAWALPLLTTPPWRYLIGVALWAGLASIVPTTAYAVLVDRVMEVRLALDRASQWRFARYVVWLCGLGPITYLALDLYINRDVTLTAYLDQGEPFSLFLLLFVGFTALTFRSQMLRGVDSWFRKERADYVESLTRLERGLRDARTIKESAAALALQVERVLRPVSAAVLVVNDDVQRLLPVTGSIGRLSADSVLVDVARTATIAVRATLGLHSRVVPLLPESDREWLEEGDVHLLAPLVASGDRLIGVMALGRAQDGIPYSQHDYTVVASMCGRTAMQLENQWLRDRPVHRAEGTGVPTGFTTLTWQNEPAECCQRCGLVWPTATSECSCGGAVAPAALPLLVEGKFRVERQLGSGGMGVVYLATDMALGRKVALKTLPSVSESLARRLQHEARAMATVRHPHLALIYGAEQWRGTPVLIVEYLEGGTLLDGLRRGPLSVQETLSLGIVLADVLDRLHLTGVLHRDVKPSNIGYTMDGLPKLLDLGLAAALDIDRYEATMLDHAGAAEQQVQPSAVALDRPSITSHSGHLLGTLRYMSPEALVGQAPQPAFDLWSLAFVLYESLAGQHPFADLDGDDVAARIQRADIPDVRDACPECPAEVAAFFRDALSAVPARRPATAAQFRSALQTLQTTLH